MSSSGSMTRSWLQSSQLSHERVIDPEDDIVPIFVLKALG
jgi:hypothetical protein